MQKVVYILAGVGVYYLISEIRQLPYYVKKYNARKEEK